MIFVQLFYCHGFAKYGTTIIIFPKLKTLHRTYRRKEMAAVQSVEPNIADLANGWLKSYRLDYKLEQESLNPEIDQALNDYCSKNGGAGGNRPDVKLLLRDQNFNDYPVLIEYKGYKDRLVLPDSMGKVTNKTAKNQPDYKVIKAYAVNGAVHYANAILHYTSMSETITYQGSIYTLLETFPVLGGGGQAVLCTDASGSRFVMPREEWLRAERETAPHPAVHGKSTPEEKISLFLSLFRGREDVYAKRYWGF